MTGREESGFTLVEVLLATFVLAIIFGVIAEAMIMGLRTTDSTDQRLRESLDAQLVSTTFVSDVQSADAVSVTDTTCGTGTPVISLSWKDPQDPTAAAATRRASYIVEADPGGERNLTNEQRVLTRAYCEAGTLVAERQVARYLASGTPVAVQCDGTACPGASPRRITMTVNDVTGFSFTLEANRRSA